MAAPNQFYEEITCEHVKDFQFISQGAFGTIFRARHQDWGIDVAVKILNSNTSFTREELLNEALAMDKARFIYVLRLFGLFIDSVQTDVPVAGLSIAAPRMGLVMEYIENGSLSSLMNRVHFVPWPLRFRILHQVAVGMNFLHNLSPPLLHLDLKPSNVLLDGELHIRVADFGLSKFKRGSSRHPSQTSEEKDGYGGTLEFMPPEAFSDLNYKPSPGTDVYSYGILMWSVLSGQEPYPYVHPGNMSSLFRRLIPQGQRPSTDELEKIDNVLKLADMIRLMKRCWHNNKAQRPSFRDCSQETKSVYSYHKPWIMAAVRQVQDILLNSSSKETRFSLSLASHGAVSHSSTRLEKAEYQQSSSSGLEEHFSTLHLKESPLKLNETVPTESFFKSHQERKHSGLYRSHSARSRKGAESSGHEGRLQSAVQIRSRPTESHAHFLTCIPLQHTQCFPLHSRSISSPMAPTKVVMDLHTGTIPSCHTFTKELHIMESIYLGMTSWEFKLEMGTSCNLNTILRRNSQKSNNGHLWSMEDFFWTIPLLSLESTPPHPSPPQSLFLISHCSH
ncbi:receptor-interacting serine/threonine-protein kinase 3 isoform X2 [Varanus komodoensis]|uniref:receptor-interacting serine/threonine-protein kinase 3 isoform X2 n=1 Tax=Varanus komodoensis TaxID=61221 RepID=UPI001CF78E90|nr:receptor-interacting serine/threonine-protein kinase 3 isoform X2 [Varanus komodoensis]